MADNALRPSDASRHDRLIRECLKQVPVEHDAAALERLGQASMADDLAAGGGQALKTTAPERRVGEVRRSIDLGLRMECVGVTPLGWAKCRLVDNPSRTESIPPCLWAEYPEVELVR